MRYVGGKRAGRSHAHQSLGSYKRIRSLSWLLKHQKENYRWLLNARGNIKCTVTWEDDKVSAGSLRPSHPDTAHCFPCFLLFILLSTLPKMEMLGQGGEKERTYSPWSLPSLSGPQRTLVWLPGHRDGVSPSLSFAHTFLWGQIWGERKRHLSWVSLIFAFSS